MDVRSLLCFSIVAQLLHRAVDYHGLNVASAQQQCSGVPDSVWAKTSTEMHLDHAQKRVAAVLAGCIRPLGGRQWQHRCACARRVRQQASDPASLAKHDLDGAASARHVSGQADAADPPEDGAAQVGGDGSDAATDAANAAAHSPDSAEPASVDSAEDGALAVYHPVARRLIHSGALHALLRDGRAVTPAAAEHAARALVHTLREHTLPSAGRAFVRQLVALRLAMESSGLMHAVLPMAFVHKTPECWLQCDFDVPLFSASDKNRQGLKLARLTALKVRLSPRCGLLKPELRVH